MEAWLRIGYNSAVPELARRPSIDRALCALVAQLRTLDPALASLDPARILFVSGAARREGRASIRPLSFGGEPPRQTSHDGRWMKPRVVVEGSAMLYEICLRPLFFLESRPERRLQILIHELWHISPDFDGTLSPERSHRPDNAAELWAVAARLADGFRERHRSSAGWLEHSGELGLRAWLRRPPSRALAGSSERALYTEADLYPSIVVQT